MSEIRVTTLKDTAGSNSSTAAEIYSGPAGTCTFYVRIVIHINSADFP